MTHATYYSYRPLSCPEELDGLPVEVYLQALGSEGVFVEKPKAPPLHYESVFGLCNVPWKTYGLAEQLATRRL